MAEVASSAYSDIQMSYYCTVLGSYDAISLDFSCHWFHSGIWKRLNLILKSNGAKYDWLRPTAAAGVRLGWGLDLSVNDRNGL